MKGLQQALSRGVSASSQTQRLPLLARVRGNRRTLRVWVESLAARYWLLRLAVSVGLLAGLALSPKLWLSSRLYPFTPVWSFLRPLAPPADFIAFLALGVLLIAVCFSSRRVIVTAVFALLTLLALQDQSRWQPWFYQYSAMLLAITLAGPRRPAAALNTCCLIVATTYIWSGLEKLNPNFAESVFPALIEPFRWAWPRGIGWIGHHAAITAPMVECGAGVGLLIRRWRRAAMFCAISMHVFILIAIGPLGRRLNTVVWPWNVAMIAFLLILFFGRVDEPTPQQILWGRGFAFQKVALLFFGVMPGLAFFNLWDHYLSAALYSGNRNTAIVYLTDDVFYRLPPGIENFIYEGATGRNELHIDAWSFGELNVPSYPEIRIYRNIARRICAYAVNGEGVELVVKRKQGLRVGRTELRYPCGVLQK